MRAAPRSCRSVRTARSATVFPWRSDMKARVLELLILLPTPYFLKFKGISTTLTGVPSLATPQRQSGLRVRTALHQRVSSHQRSSGPGAGACHHHLLCDDQAVPIHDVHLEYRFEGVGCAGYAQGTLHSVADGGRLHQYCRGHEPLIVAAIDRMVQDY